MLQSQTADQPAAPWEEAQNTTATSQKKNNCAMTCEFQQYGILTSVDSE